MQRNKSGHSLCPVKLAVLQDLSKNIQQKKVKNEDQREKQKATNHNEETTEQKKQAKTDK
jgi:hypothetical protein